MQDESDGVSLAALKADCWRQFGDFRWTLVLRGVLRRRNYRALVTMRLCQAAAQRGGVALLFARMLHACACWSAALDLPWRVAAGPGLAITHGWGLVVNEQAVLGSNVTLFHGVTLGRRDDIDVDGLRTIRGSPVVEDDVWIGPGASVIGPVTIGRGSRIAPGTVVYEDVPPQSIVMGNPARIVKAGCSPDVFNRWEPEPALPGPMLPHTSM
jgi:serine O-acetyltransferase